jgi:SAM-dependent methyltransferase
VKSIEFIFAQGDQRAATGSHYTPDELVQPLIKHSLDYLIADKLKEAKPEQALLDLRVADIACGSGHILLAAARRIATELAIVRTGEEQPSPSAFRAAIRDVIRQCIYGVDLNPLAVELCKVALWLEAHNPGEPLNFLDHHIKCGNAIVGFAKREELERGIPDEAFSTQPGDEKDIAALFRKKNKDERNNEGQLLVFDPVIEQQLDAIVNRWRELSNLPEQTPAQIDSKKHRFQEFSQSQDAWTLSEIAAMPIA